MRNKGKLSLRVPQPKHRPGDQPDFTGVIVPEVGDVARPPVDAKAGDITKLAYSLIRVLDGEGRAAGPWDPKLDAETLRRGLKAMMLTRAYDDRMYRAQRQGKTSFYMKMHRRGGGQRRLRAGARQSGYVFSLLPPAGTADRARLSARRHDVPGLFQRAAIRSKAASCRSCIPAREFGFFTISGNLGTQFPPSRRLGDGLGLSSGGERIAAAWIGEGATAEGDFHHALNFASVYRAPVILNVVNNQWAISCFQGIAGGEQSTFAARAIGYGLAGLRVDGNDFLAVYAVTQWAAERARANLGATLIELYTYRAEGHSTSDDPARYRPADECESLAARRSDRAVEDAI